MVCKKQLGLLTALTSDSDIRSYSCYSLAASPSSPPSSVVSSSPLSSPSISSSTATHSNYLLQICKKWIKEFAFIIYPVQICCRAVGGLLETREPPVKQEVGL
jgi:hypothetical protein